MSPGDATFLGRRLTLRAGLAYIECPHSDPEVIVFDLPQIILPAIVFNAVIVALCTAAAWHAIAVVQALLRRNRPERQ
jgi:hypothetical protein